MYSGILYLLILTTNQSRYKVIIQSKKNIVMIFTGKCFDNFGFQWILRQFNGSICPIYPTCSNTQNGLNDDE